MNRTLAWLNLFGVFALGVFCVFQWRFNRQANLQAYALEKLRHEQGAKIAEQDKTIHGQKADLQTFREQIISVTQVLKKTEAELVERDGDLRKLQVESDQLKISITNWSAAVTARDEQLKEANKQLQDLAKARNDAVVKFNELADRYNGLVKELNETRAKLPAAPPPAPPPKK